MGLAEDREDHAKSRHILRISRRGWAGKNDRLGITDPDVFKTTVLGGRSKTITFEVPGHETEAALMTNITIMAGGKKLYDALTESGRVGTQGIYFDTGSDRIRPESTPTLKEIGEMLKEHADLKLTIEGHTDNVGAADANQKLSDQRAAAVKAFLVATYAIEPARLQSIGMGSTKSVAPNTTPEGRQQNRRVELVKN